MARAASHPTLDSDPKWGWHAIAESRTFIGVRSVDGHLNQAED
jgi:hypothetical protein